MIKVVIRTESEDLYLPISWRNSAPNNAIVSDCLPYLNLEAPDWHEATIECMLYKKGVNVKNKTIRIKREDYGIQEDR